MTDGNEFVGVIKDSTTIRQAGLTKREYFAAMALQGVLSNNQTTLYKNGYSTENVATVARQMADALIEALNNNPKPKPNA